MIYYNADFELTQRLHMLIKASQFMITYIIPLSFVIFKSGKCEKKGKKYRKLNNS